MEMNNWGWTKATTLPKDGIAILLAIPSSDGAAWVFEFGGYYESGDIFAIDGHKMLVKKAGYYFYSARYGTLLPAKAIKYWTYIDEPSDIGDELIIISDDQ